jgi:phage terminase large subunit
MDDRQHIAEAERRVKHARKVTSSQRSMMIEREICRNDPVYWLNNYLYRHDPREPNAYVPFVAFPKQESFIRWLMEREKTRTTGLAEKSRDAGLSSLGCAYGIHGFLFRDGFKMGFGSNKEEYVDSIGDSKSIFEKLRFQIRNLPEWQLPKGWDPRAYMNFRRIVNPQNGALLTGEAGDNLGRGDRTSIYWLDEAASVDRAGDVEAALSQTSNVRIFVSMSWHRVQVESASPVL